MLNNRNNKKELYTKIIVFILILVLNFLTIHVADDYGYAVNNGFLDIFVKEYNHYLTWSGRTIAHLLARTFLSLPKFIFNIFNSLCFVYLTSLIHNHVLKTNKEFNLVIFLLSTLSVFLLTPAFGETVLWELGSCNYMWTTTILLAFLLRYRLALTDKEKNYYLFLMFLFGIISGWTNENTGGVLILMLLFIGIEIWLKKEYKSWMFVGSLGAFIGFILLLSSPGNKIRAQEYPVNTNGKVYYVIHEIISSLNIFENNQIYLWIIIAITIGLLIYKKEKFNKIYEILSYSVGGIAGIMAIILSPSPISYDRSMFGATIFIIIAFVLSLHYLKDLFNLDKLVIGILAIMSLLTIFNYSRAFLDLSYTRYLYQRRENYITNQKSQGNNNITLPSIKSEFNTLYNAVTHLTDLSNYRYMWANDIFAKAHNLNSVEGTSYDKWNLIYKDGDSRLMNIVDFNEYINEIKEKDNLIIIITSTRLNTKDYASSLNTLKSLGLDIKDEEHIYISSIIDNTGELIISNIDTSPVESTYQIQDAFIYASASNDEISADITINNIEYTNDNKGISIVVYDYNNKKVLDSISVHQGSNYEITRSVE